MSGYFRTVLLAVMVVAAVHSAALAHGAHSPEADMLADSQATASLQPDTGTVAIDEKPGAFVPLDLPFTTQDGKRVQLRDLITGPTILSMVYYRCPNVCGLLLSSIAGAVRPFADNPAKAPNVVTLSVDERETPADARKAQGISLESIEKPYPRERWHFLTGSAESINQVARAVGFRFARRGGEIEHPMAIIVLSPQGKITRYIMGTDYLPMDISLSLMEASSGAVQPTIARVMRICFRYDPRSHAFVFNILQVSATIVFALLGTLVVFLIVYGARRRPRRAGS